MKPYLAILIDSFVEAVASKVLWILLIGWTVILGAIAPFGFVQEQTYQFVDADIKDRATLIRQLKSALAGKGNQSQQLVAAAMSDEYKTKIKSYADEKPAENRGRDILITREVVAALNGVLEKRELYDEKAWPTAAKRANLKDLVAKKPESLSDSELQERNRRLVENAFMSSVRATRGEGLWIGYAGLKMGNPLPVTRSQAVKFVELFALQTIIKLGLGVVAIFVAIVVTSPLIPDMLQAGSLHLLLSKPISRSLLFLSKFVGGSIFVLLNITYLLVGLYFIAGFRFDLWNEGLILVIPVVVFVFMIFFSVSALAGVIWRNAIVSVVVVLVFWLMCFIVGVVREGLRALAISQPQVLSLTEMDGQLFASTQIGQFQVWNAENSRWQGVVSNDPDFGRKVLGPIRLADKDQFVFARAARGDFGLRGVRGNLQIVDLSTEVKAASKEDPKVTKSNYESPRWQADEGPDAPQNARQFIAWKGTALALAEDGLYRLDTEKLKAVEDAPNRIMSFLRIPSQVVNPFERVSPPGWFSERPDFLTVSRDGETLLLYRRGTVERLVWKEKQFETDLSVKIEGEEAKPGIVAIGQKYVVVTRPEEPLQVLDATTLQVTKSIPNPKNRSPRQLWSIPGGDKFVVVFHGGRFAVADAEAGTLVEPSFEGQGDVTSATIGADGNPWIAYRARFVVKWDMANSKVTERRVAPQSTPQWIYETIVNPIYLLNPKPAALDNTVSYLLEGKDTIEIPVDTVDNENPQEKLDPWEPIWSNAIFVAVLLTISCIYLVRQEF